MKSLKFGRSTTFSLGPSKATQVAPDAETPLPVTLFDDSDFSAKKIQHIFFEKLELCKDTKEKMKLFTQFQLFLGQIEATHNGMKEEWVEDAVKYVKNHESTSGAIFTGVMERYYVKIGKQEGWIKELRRFEEVTWGPLWEKTQEEGGVMDHLKYRFSKYW